MLENFMSILKIVLRRSGHTLDGDTNHVYRTYLFFYNKKTILSFLLNGDFIFKKFVDIVRDEKIQNCKSKIS